jgi:hypothetical protein
VDGEVRHLVGLLLGTEEDWPRAFEHLMAGLGPVRDDAGRRHVFATERLTIEPFSLRAKPRTGLVIDRLAYWYYHPREWLKKVALMDDVYLLNSPFTFQSMEKHAAYCAMIRLGLKVPETVLVPYKNPVDHDKYAFTARSSGRREERVAARSRHPLALSTAECTAEHLAGSARIELATVCLGGSRTSFVLRAAPDAGRVEAAVGLEPTCTALQAAP